MNHGSHQVQGNPDRVPAWWTKGLTQKEAAGVPRTQLQSLLHDLLRSGRPEPYSVPRDLHWSGKAETLNESNRTLQCEASSPPARVEEDGTRP